MKRNRVIWKFAISKIWILVFIMVVFTISNSLLPLNSKGQNVTCAPNKQQDAATRQWDEFVSQFPVVEYDTPIISDFKKRNERILKNNRYDTKGILSVFSSLPEDGEGVTLSLESLPLDGIPTIESELIITGEITEVEAHLSNNKKGVYSEFTVRIDEILKNNSEKLNNNSQITFDRIGGVVRYSNGKTRIYNIRQYGIPKIGQHYVLFLKNTEKSPNYELLTGYELKTDKTVINLDDFLQF